MQSWKLLLLVLVAFLASVTVVHAQGGDYCYLWHHYRWEWYRTRYTRVNYPVWCCGYWCRPACRTLYGGWGPCR